MKLKEVAELWFKSPGFQSLASRSREIYAQQFRKLAKFHAKEINEITRPMIVKWRDETYQTPSVCRISIATLSNIFRFAVDNGYATGNPVYGIKGLPATGHIERWSEEHIHDFLNRAQPHLADAVALAFYTGQRISDLVRIRWEDVSDKLIFVRQQKTGRKLYIPRHKNLAQYIERRQATMRRMRRKIPYVIFNSRGDGWTAKALSEAVSKENRKLGYNGKKFHGIRKTTASLLAEMGCTPSQIMAITGHTTLKEVTRYTAEAEQRRLAMQAMEKFDG